MSSSDPIQRRRAFNRLLLATVFWGISFPTIKAMLMVQAALAPQASNWFLCALGLALRFGLAALLLAAWQGRIMGNIQSLEWRQGLGLGLFGSAASLLQMDALAIIDASISAFLTQMYCIIIPVFLCLRYRRWPSVHIVICCLLVLTGAGILSGFDWSTMRLGRGELETLAAAALFSCQILWLERPVYRSNHPARTSVIMFVVTALTSIPVAALSPHQPGDWQLAYSTLSPWLFLTLLIFCCTLLSYLFMIYWQPKITATEASLIYAAEPVFASLFALFLPAWFSQWTRIDYANETMTWRLIFGGGLIMAANIYLQKRNSQDSLTPPSG